MRCKKGVGTKMYKHLVGKPLYNVFFIFHCSIENREVSLVKNREENSFKPLQPICMVCHSIYYTLIYLWMGGGMRAKGSRSL